jgi:elongation factor G
MAKYESKSIRNIAVVGHGGTGKTSLCESFLFVAGKTDRLGRVDDGSSCMDFEPEEHKRHVSITSANNFFDWTKCKINIVDTPGDSNFSFDTQNCLRIVDGAVVVVTPMVVSIPDQKVCEYADENKLPRIVFINAWTGTADFFNPMHNDEKIKVKTTPLYLPIGKEDGFKGLVDLLTMKACLFEGPKGACRMEEIPADLADEAGKYRETLVEDIAETDESLMEQYLDAGELGQDDLVNGLRRAVMSGAPFPWSAV